MARTKGADGTGAKKKVVAKTVKSKPRALEVGGAAARSKKPARGSHPSYKSYIFKVLKQIHPALRMSAKAMTVMNALSEDVCEKVAYEASRLVHLRKRSTLSSRDIQSAVQLVFPGELRNHAAKEGIMAVSKVATANSLRTNKIGSKIDGLSEAETATILSREKAKKRLQNV